MCPLGLGRLAVPWYDQFSVVLSSLAKSLDTPCRLGKLRTIGPARSPLAVPMPFHSRMWQLATMAVVPAMNFKGGRSEGPLVWSRSRSSSAAFHPWSLIRSGCWTCSPSGSTSGMMERAHTSNRLAGTSIEDEVFCVWAHTR